jgi:hypothetical protein
VDGVVITDNTGVIATVIMFQQIPPHWWIVIVIVGQGSSCQTVSTTMRYHVSMLKDPLMAGGCCDGLYFEQ